MKRISGVTIFAIIGLLFVLESLARLLLFMRPFNIISGVMHIIFILSYICLIKRMNWARLFHLFIYSALLLFTCLATIIVLLMQRFTETIKNVFGGLPTPFERIYFIFAMCYPIIFVYYFTRPKVKEQFMNFPARKYEH